MLLRNNMTTTNFILPTHKMRHIVRKMYGLKIFDTIKMQLVQFHSSNTILTLTSTLSGVSSLIYFVKYFSFFVTTPYLKFSWYFCFLNKRSVHWPVNRSMIIDLHWQNGFIAKATIVHLRHLEILHVWLFYLFKKQ